MASTQAEFPSRTVILSADGMRPDFYRHPKKFGLKIPNILELVESGASADSAEGIYPSTTYPSHAPLVTGVRPRQHGIYSHLASLAPTTKAPPRTRSARAVGRPSLPGCAGLSARNPADIAWPVTAVGRINY